jgi:hypothetical protein
LKKALAVAALVWVALFSRAPAQTPVSPDSAAKDRPGVLFDVEFSPHATSASPPGGYWVTVGVGCRANALISFLLQIMTGSDLVDEGAARPVWGRFLTGGARLEGTLCFLEHHSWHPFVSLEYGFYTILNQQGSGYNGGGPGFGMGFETDLSRNFGFRAGVEYRRISYASPVRDTDPTGAFEPFAVQQVGITVRMTFFPSF